jgi:hypothetical protein
MRENSDIISSIYISYMSAKFCGAKMPCRDVIA